MYEYRHTLPLPNETGGADSEGWWAGRSTRCEGKLGRPEWAFSIGSDRVDFNERMSFSSVE